MDSECVCAAVHQRIAYKSRSVQSTWNQCQWSLGFKQTYFTSSRLCSGATSDGADDDDVEVVAASVSSTLVIAYTLLFLEPFYWQIPVLANSSVVTCTPKFRYFQILLLLPVPANSVTCKFTPAKFYYMQIQPPLLPKSTTYVLIVVSSVNAQLNWSSSYACVEQSSCTRWPSWQASPSRRSSPLMSG